MSKIHRIPSSSQVASPFPVGHRSREVMSCCCGPLVTAGRTPGYRSSREGTWSCGPTASSSYTSSWGQSSHRVSAQDSLPRPSPCLNPPNFCAWCRTPAAQPHMWSPKSPVGLLNKLPGLSCAALLSTLWPQPCLQALQCLGCPASLDLWRHSRGPWHEQKIRGLVQTLCKTRGHFYFCLMLFPLRLSNKHHWN